MIPPVQVLTDSTQLAAALSPLRMRVLARDAGAAVGDHPGAAPRPVAPDAQLPPARARARRLPRGRRRAAAARLYRAGAEGHLARLRRQPGAARRAVGRPGRRRAITSRARTCSRPQPAPIRDVAVLGARARAVDQRLATFTIDCEIGFASPAAFPRSPRTSRRPSPPSPPSTTTRREEPPLPRRHRIASGGDQEQHDAAAETAAHHAVSETTTQQREEIVMPRKQKHEIVIDAPIEAVWKAISDGEELTRWFVEAATVEPGVGGTISVSWGGGERSAEQDRSMGAEPEAADEAGAVRHGRGESDPAVPMIDEYTIERRDGKTVLRLVSSGIPDAPEWDGFYNGTDTGWESFFRTLRHYSSITAASRARPSRSLASWPARSRMPGRVCAPRLNPWAPLSSTRRRRFSKRTSAKSARPTSRTRCRRRRSNYVYTICRVRKNADRGRGDSREVAAVAGNGLGSQRNPAVSEAACNAVNSNCNRSRRTALQYQIEHAARWPVTDN